MGDKPRCEWCSQDPLYIQYHDQEWGVPSFDDRHLFEMLILEGAQAGLSWLTVLKKRDNYRKAFDGFEAQKMARYSQSRVEKLLQNPGIIRNRLKLNAAVINAQVYLKVLDEYPSFAEFIWQFVDGEPIINHWSSLKQIPVTTAQSDAMSKQLKNRGFKFIGPTICYAYMQAVGMVNDHTRQCFKYPAK
ncbi:MAG: DNA-3-methyladenine glycosylase I [Gammaproteobacteria bacterium]